GDYGEVLVMDWGLAKIVRNADVGGASVPRDTVGGPPPAREERGAETPRLQDGAPPAARAPAGIVSDRQEVTALQTLAGSMMGTPAYMSPEQAKGELDHIDARSDLWSLGAILYEILTLERAVSGDTTYAILANVLKGHIVPPEQRAPKRNVPRELSAIVMKCLHKNRAHRYRSVLDLRRDISLFLEGRSVSAAPDTFSQAVVKLIKRNKGVSAAVGAAAVLLIAITTVFIVRLAGERNRALASERRAVTNEKAAVAARDAQHAIALAASKRQAESAVRAASEGRMTEAEARATAAVEVMPDGPWGHYALGVLAHEKKDFAAARKHLDEALRLDPDHQPSTLLHITVLAASGDLAHFETLAAEADKCSDWKALVAAGHALYGAQRYAPSAKAFQRAVALMQKEKGTALHAIAQARDKAERSSACLKTEGFWDSIKNLPHQEQRARIASMLDEIYPRSPGSTVSASVLPTSAGELAINLRGPAIRWLDPLRTMPLTSLRVIYAQVSDLAPLRGMPLRTLDLTGTTMSDLGPLKGMPLEDLIGVGANVSDLAPLMGMPLRRLWCDAPKISDISPLKGMPLAELAIQSRGVTDLSPLAGMSLARLSVKGTSVTDLRPLRGMPLWHLRCSGCSALKDLNALRGLPLKELFCENTGVTNLEPLRGMPLLKLVAFGTGVKDLTPLAGLKLKEFSPPSKRQLTAESLKVVEELEKQGCKINWTE
ncbi:MAG TPA: tetratricopeptide repeat protein, partial [Planctomycetota bacterium]|nr:tetratricopeptide repeat protein [Planctomycetota bacterium]